MRKFAVTTHALPGNIKGDHVLAKKMLKKKTKVAATTAAGVWLDSLNLVLDGDLGKIQSIPNNTISRFLSREWAWLNLVKPAEAETYYTMQQAEKEAHEATHPGYVYKPAKRTIRTHMQKCNNKPKSRKPPKMTAEATPRTQLMPILAAPLQPSLQVLRESALRAGSDHEASSGFEGSSLVSKDGSLRELLDALDDDIFFAEIGGDAGCYDEAAETLLHSPTAAPVCEYEAGPAELEMYGSKDNWTKEFF